MKNYELRITNYKMRTAKILCVLCVLLCGFSFNAAAQSTNQSYPTPISSGEISGKIAARDVGDARLTSYFFVFNGTQGDIFINVKTANLDGDIDVFAAENLRPLTKITVFSDAPESETGRVIYLRKPEKMILRVQGRSPNDAAATFNLKFAGSFAPAAVAENAAPELPEVKIENQSDIQVNSVGTIIAVKPKPTPLPKEIVAENEPPPIKTKANKTKRTAKKTGDAEAKNTEEKTNAEKTAEDLPSSAPENTPDANAAPKPAVVVTDETAEDKTATTPTAAAKKPRKKAAPIKKSPAPNALENVRLLILFKDGTKIERAMSEVLRVNVDKSGVLTLITRDGAIARYSILDVAKMTIE